MQFINGSLVAYNGVIKNDDASQVSLEARIIK